VAYLAETSHPELEALVLPDMLRSAIMSMLQVGHGRWFLGSRFAGTCLQKVLAGNCWGITDVEVGQPCCVCDMSRLVSSCWACLEM
jgi:hypothetical protein